MPMTPGELIGIRKAIHSPYVEESSLPLTEAEVDEAIRNGVNLPWKIVRKLPHVLAAWKMRLEVSSLCKRLERDCAECGLARRTRAVPPCLGKGSSM